MSALRIPVLMILAVSLLGVAARVVNIPSTASRESANLAFAGQELLQQFKPYNLVNKVAWVPFRNPQRILYQSLPENSPAYQQELKCLALAVYFEARSEPAEGQLAVAQVVLNRVRSDDYPKSVCGVVFQGKGHGHNCQFSFACDGLSNNPTNPVAWREALSIAETALAHQQDDITLDATHYHAVYVDPAWAATLKPTVKLGSHIFYRAT